MPEAPWRQQRFRGPAARPPRRVQVPPGCARYSVKLSKPLGLVLEEDKFGNIFVVRAAQ